MKFKDEIPVFSIEKGHGRCSLVRLEDGRHAAVFHVSDKEVELSTNHTMESLFENQNTMPLFGLYINDSDQAAALSNVFKMMAEQMKQEESEC